MIEQAIKKALQRETRKVEFLDQIKKNEEFHDRMERAGVVTRKQGFTIPLMERIAQLSR